MEFYRGEASSLQFNNCGCLDKLTYIVIYNDKLASNFECGISPGLVFVSTHEMTG